MKPTSVSVGWLVSEGNFKILKAIWNIYERMSTSHSKFLCRPGNGLVQKVKIELKSVLISSNLTVAFIALPLQKNLRKVFELL
jgi:hypothetical protein